MHVVCCLVSSGAALLVRVPLSIGASDLTGACAREWIRVVFEIVVTFYFQPFILMGYDSICRRGFQTP